MASADRVTHEDLIAKNKRTSIIMLASEFLLIGTLGGLIGLLVTGSVGAGILVGAAVAIAVNVIGWLLAVRATIRLTRAVEVDATQARVLHNVIEGLCIAMGLPKPKVYIVDDPAPNAFAFGRSPEHSGVAVTSGLLDLLSRRELEGVLAHELSHIRNRDVQVTTLAVTTVGILVVVADISARGAFWSDWGDDDGGGIALVLVAAVAAVLAFGAKLLSFAISRHREELADSSAVAIVSPGGLRRALEKLEADLTVVNHVSHATAHLWIESPLQKVGSKRLTKTNSLFATHPPIADRIAVLRRLEGLDPDERGPVDQTITGVPVDLAQLGESAARREQPLPSMQAIQPSDTPEAQAAALAAAATTPGWVSRNTVVAPVGKPPGWYYVDDHTLRYWQGVSWTMWFATWNGKRWVQTSRSA